MAISTDEAKQWPKQDKRRFLHAVYRVGDLDATIDYYKTHFGMKQLRYRDVPDVSKRISAQAVVACCAYLKLLHQREFYDVRVHT